MVIYYLTKMIAVGRAVDIKPVRFDAQKSNVCLKIYRYPYCNTQKVKINFKIKQNRNR